ncbi:MAG: spermidine/putrescine ABC transporter substrate-binding protein [Clostridiales bacterium]|nr:MAG: spermidine/putrescine ABC transporter substrate-binding protein [Clostridiales bacterium]
MKKVLSLLMIALMLAAPFTAFADGEDAVPLTGEVVYVYNWNMYIADGSEGSINVNEEFTRRTGIKVVYDLYDTNEIMYTKLKTGGANYDVIIPSDYMIGKLVEEDMLAPLNFDNIPNYQYIDEQFKNRNYDPDNLYSVPYTWGTVGIIYNTKYVTEPVDSWSLLWDEAYKGKILMFDNSRDAFAISQLLLGQDVNTTSTADLDAASQKLAEQKDLVQDYIMDQVFGKMEHEEAWIAPYYAGDYLTMLENNENLAFCFPKEGYNLFIDAMCIPKNAQNKEAAEKYINFLCDPEIMAANLDFLGYSAPASEAKQYMDEELVASEIAYPSAEVLERGVTFENLPTDTIQYMNDQFNSVKASGSGWSLYIIIAAVVLLVAVGAVIFVRKKKRNSY